MKYATGSRLKNIADTLFEGNRSELARNMDMKPQALTKYLNGESMPGGVVLMRLHDLGVNINWFLTGEGEMLIDPPGERISEPLEQYLIRLEEELTEGREKNTFNDLMSFSETVRKMDASPSLQRALLLVYARHIGEE